MGLEAHVTVLDVSLPRLYELDLQFGAMLNTIYSTTYAIEEHVIGADLVIGAVLLPGAAAPKLITEAMVKQDPTCLPMDVFVAQMKKKMSAEREKVPA